LPDLEKENKDVAASITAISDAIRSIANLGAPIRSLLKAVEDGVRTGVKIKNIFKTEKMISAQNDLVSHLIHTSHGCQQIIQYIDQYKKYEKLGVPERAEESFERAKYEAHAYAGFLGRIRSQFEMVGPLVLKSGLYFDVNRMLLVGASACEALPSVTYPPSDDELVLVEDAISQFYSVLDGYITLMDRVERAICSQARNGAKKT